MPALSGLPTPRCVSFTGRSSVALGGGGIRQAPRQLPRGGCQAPGSRRATRPQVMTGHQPAHRAGSQGSPSLSCGLQSWRDDFCILSKLIAPLPSLYCFYQAFVASLTGFRETNDTMPMPSRNVYFITFIHDWRQHLVSWGLLNLSLPLKTTNSAFQITQKFAAISR